MSSNPDPTVRPTVQKGRSFIEEARRAQIVSCAIDTIAELGYSQASLARIAERARISKGVIGYHFAGKEDLIGQIVREVLARATEYMRPRITAESTGRDMLRAYIESNLAFMGEYRNHVLAIVEIARNARQEEGESSLDPALLEGAVGSLAQLLTRFQATGDFRPDFDPIVMAVAIRAAIDAVPRRLANDPTLDVERYGDELANLFDRATRAAASRPRTRSARPNANQ
ncbi:MAG TPA: TetR family transcriptional regulator [Solirubrobacteraceae bacterium]|jgi:AcrR family transcriptional regulator